MGFSAGFEATIFVNGTDISAYTEKVTPSLKRTSLDLPRLGGNSVARLVGPYQTELKLDGWIDPTVTTVLFPLANASSPATVPIIWKPEGSAGVDTRTGNGYISEYEETADAKEAAKWTATILIDGNWT